MVRDDLDNAARDSQDSRENGTLRRHGDFRMLWAGNAVSQFGTRIGTVATPLLAVGVLAATPFQVGLLNAAQTVGLLLVGLPAGAWVDRMRRRRLMISMDLARAGLLATIPIAGWFGVLTLWHLLAVLVVAGAATVFFDVAQLSYLPTLIGREHLLEGNAKLQTSQSVAVIAGPGLGGWLVGLLGAASTVLATAIGFIVSAVQLNRIRVVEPAPRVAAERNLPAEIAEGLRLVFGHPILRAIACCTASANLFLAVVITLNVLFLNRQVGYSAAVTGVLLASSGTGGLLGALTGRRLVNRIGRGRSCWLALLATQPFALLLPLAAQGWRTALFALGWFVVGLGSTVYNIAQVTLRQALCPDRLLGRMNASNRFIVWGTLPLGSVAAGALADEAGARNALWVGAAGLACAVGWLLLSPVRRLRDVAADDGPNPERAP
jgi:predicted MFS family arabinose efflux permease